MRKLSPIDRIFSEIEEFARTLGGGHRATTGLDSLLDQQSPPPSHPRRQNHDDDFAGRKESANLLRVDHSGEIAAQALYRGQALTSKDKEVREQLLKAADEEIDHLVWCQERLEQLDDRPSVLGPLWYCGSFALGAFVGAFAPKLALGFVEETELQVARHLEYHLRRLPREDWRSAVILARMRADELRHADWAKARQAQRPRPFVRMVMSATSKLMTRTSHYI